MSMVMTVGQRLGPNTLDLIGPEEPGIPPERLVTTADTKISPGVFEAGGCSVLVDIEEVDGERVATFVRRFDDPDPIDISRFEAVLAAFRRAEVDDLVGANADVALRSAFAELSSHWDPKDYLTQLFLGNALERDMIFPTMWWDDDAIVASQPLDANTDEQAEEAARDALCASLCEVANELLADAGSARRFCGPFYSDFNDGEPNWLFTSAAQYEALVHERLIVPWDPALRTPTVHTYKRPPDRGEIDLSNFPSGDDPF